MATYEVLKLGVGLNTSSAEQALSNLKRTITRAYSSETATKFDVQVQKTTAKLEEQRRKAETLRKQLNDIATSQVTPKSIEDLSEKVKKGEQQISSLAVKLSDLNTKKEELLSTGLEIGGKTIFTESTRAEINKVNIELRETEQQLKGISNTTETARASLQKLKANPALTVEFKKANEALLKTEDELQATKTQLKALQTQGKNTGNALTSSFDKTSQSVRKFGKKLAGMVKRVFVFTVITKALRSLRSMFASLIKSDDELSNSLSKIKGNLLMAFAPIYETIIPWLRAFFNMLVNVTSALAHFINVLFGNPMSNAVQTAQKLQSTLQETGDKSKDIDKTSSSLSDMNDNLSDLEDTSEDVKKSLLNFDELNILGSEDNDLIDLPDPEDVKNVSDNIEDLNNAVNDLQNSATFTVFDDLYTKIEALMEKFKLLILSSMLVLGIILLFTGNVPLGLALIIAALYGMYREYETNWEGLRQNITDEVAELTAILIAAQLVLGAILIFSGANIPLGIALIVAAVAESYSLYQVSWDLVSEKCQEIITKLGVLTATVMIALGIVLIFTGTNIPAGVALIVAGLGIGAVAVVVNWDYISSNITNVFGIIQAVIAGALLAIGVVLLFTGTPAGIAAGIALIITGLAVAADTIVNWDEVPTKVAGVIQTIEAALGAAMLVLGAVLIFAGHPALGIAVLISAIAIESVVVDWELVPDKTKEVLNIILAVMGDIMLVVGAIALFTGNIAAGIALLITGIAIESVVVDWELVPDKFKEVLATILATIGTAMIAIGAIVLFTGNVAVGIALLIAGVTVETIAVDWELVPNKVKEIITSLAGTIGTALFVIGAIVLCLGQIPIGLGLLLAGAAGIVTAVAAAPEELRTQVEQEIAKYLAILGGALLVIGAILCFCGGPATLPIGLALLAAGGISLLGGAALGLSSATGLMDTMNKSLSDMNKNVADKFDGMEDTVSDSMNDVDKQVSDGVKKAADTFDQLNGRTATMTANVVYSDSGSPAAAKVPALASGAVIPPNKQFMAVLGDQKSGTNVEAPLSTIKQAVSEVMGQSDNFGGNININFTGNLAQLARVLNPQISKENVRAGSSLITEAKM